MKIALIGYGKMGKAIEEIGQEINQKATSPKYEFPLIVDIHNRDSLLLQDLQQVDVAIEFTSPHTAIKNIEWCFEANIPVVVGSTGWTEHLPRIQQYARDNNKAFLFSPNFSIGVNIFFEVNRILANIMNAHPDYAISLEEIHHTEKKDAPSGTGLHAALDILKRVERKKDWVNDRTQDDAILPIISKRIADVPGTHTVTYSSAIDTIELTHTAHNRKGFASGALLAAEWLVGKKGAYSMEDVLGFNQQ